MKNLVSLSLALPLFAIACGSGDTFVVDAGPPPAPDASPPASDASTGDVIAQPPPKPTYLALGDSIAFGYNKNHRTWLSNGTSVELPDQAAYAIGYPESLTKMVHDDAHVALDVADISCPGEAVGSLVTGAHVDDNDCWENRQKYALHYVYDHEDYDHRDGTEANKENYGSATSQLDWAQQLLADDPNHVKLITITAGANDALRYGGAACDWTRSLWDVACMVGGTIDAVLNEVQARWQLTLTAIATSGYTGPVVAVLYYSTGYRLTDLPMRAGIKLLNAKIHDAAKAVLAVQPTLNLKFVESYDLFQAGSSAYGGDVCKAGLTMLMTAGPDKGTCDVHPSNEGEALLASAVWKSLTFAEQQAVIASGHPVQ